MPANRSRTRGGEFTLVPHICLLARFFFFPVFSSGALGASVNLIQRDGPRPRVCGSVCCAFLFCSCPLSSRKVVRCTLLFQRAWHALLPLPNGASYSKPTITLGLLPQTQSPSPPPL